MSNQPKLDSSRIQALRQELVDVLREVPERGDWLYDGRDIFTEEYGPDGHRLILPLPETFHESQRIPDSVARLIVAAVNYARASCPRGGTGE